MKKTLLILAIILFAVGCATTGNIPTSALACDYYTTYEGVTLQSHPDKDWPYVTIMNAVEPKTTVVYYLWIDYTANTLVLNSVNTLTDEHSCMGFLFEDVSPVPTEDWMQAPFINYVPLSCEMADKELEEALKRNKV
jgi:uncharacterized protein YceK